MSVYFIKAEGRIKIGFSDDVPTRVKQVLSAYPEGELLASMPGDRELEKFFHRKFAADRIFGEWFTPTDELLSLVEMCQSANSPEKDKVRGSLLTRFEDRFSEDSADCLFAYITAAADQQSGFAAAAEWSGIAISRLQQIYDGAAFVTAAEYSICRALGEAAGKPKIEKVDL